MEIKYAVPVKLMYVYGSSVEDAPGLLSPSSNHSSDETEGNNNP